MEKYYLFFMILILTNISLSEGDEDVECGVENKLCSGCVKDLNDEIYCETCDDLFGEVYFTENHKRCCISLTPNCMTYNNDCFSCASCEVGFIVTNAGECVEGNYLGNCQVADDALHCYKCKETDHLVVSGKYENENAPCIEKPSKLENCRAIEKNNGPCYDCLKDYNLVSKDGDTSTKICIKSGNCLKGDDSNGFCTECNNGYLLVVGMCYKKEGVLEHCEKTNDNNKCDTKCETGYLKASDNCYEKTGKFLHCKEGTVNSSTGEETCTSCEIGFEIDVGDGSCKSPSAGNEKIKLELEFNFL